MEVPRISAQSLSVHRFLSEYIGKNRPVVVTGALDQWNVERDWTPDALEKRFGERSVQVYNNYFDLQDLIPLREFLAQYLGKPAIPPSARVLPYVRWYTQLRDVDFDWADDVFAELKNQWHLPSFLPDRGYVLPWSVTARTSPVDDAFPAKALFISPSGARTSLHVDPWASCSILCQLYGAKLWYLYSPDQARYLRNEHGVVDVTAPDDDAFPEFRRARLTATCRLQPGEIIYVPNGWYHHVESLTDSVSLTWSFVHCTTVLSFRQWLEAGPSQLDVSVLRYFYRLRDTDDAVGQVLELLRDVPAEYGQWDGGGER